MSIGKKIALIVAGGCIAAGLLLTALGLAAINLDFSALNSFQLESNSYPVTETFTSISIESVEADIRLIPSDTGTCSISCTESDKVRHTVQVENGVLTLNRVDTRKWYEHIGFFWGKMEISLFLPEQAYEKLYLKAVSGDISVPEGFIFTQAEVKSTSGNINFKASVSDQSLIKTTSGNIRAGNISGHLLEVHSTSGEITLSDLNLNHLTAGCTSGDITLSDVTIAQKMALKTVSGDIEFEDTDAGDLQLEAVSGDIEGTLRTPKVFTVKTVSGDAGYPVYSGSPNEVGKCQVETTSGDITIEIEIIG